MEAERVRHKGNASANMLPMGLVLRCCPFERPKEHTTGGNSPFERPKKSIPLGVTCPYKTLFLNFLRTVSTVS